MTEPAGPREVFARFQHEVLTHAPDLTDGLWADDVVVEMPFAPDGTPRRIEGREAFAAYARAGRAALSVRFEAFRNVVFHETADPEVVVVEYEIAGAVATGRLFSAPFILVLRARGGQIVHWREYQNTGARTA